MSINRNGVNIDTISGGIVNFGGAVYISPVSISKTVTGAGEGNTAAVTSTRTKFRTSNERAVSDIIDFIRRSL